MMHLFQHSLTGADAQWFARLDLMRFHSWTDLSQKFIRQYLHNAEMATDRLYLIRMRQNAEETFRHYALR